MAKHFVIATAGHVDHGKSTLVKALTGTDPDRLPEEKLRGITIDLGFAHLRIPVEPASTETLELGIVDVPGHEDFVKNMVAGVGAVDLALLVVAADDGWMPQTEEHLQILTYLGVKRCVVALTKCDLAESRLDALNSAIRERLHDSPFRMAPVVPCSALGGRGVSELLGELAMALRDAPEPRDIGKPRLAIDRTFLLKGFGTVVTGTLIGGSLRKGQTVVIQPGGKITRIRTIQNHHREIDSAEPGMRVALNLPDVSLAATTAAGPVVARGNLITVPEMGSPSQTIDVSIERLSRATGPLRARSPLRHADLVHVHSGCSAIEARLILVERSDLLPGQEGLAQLRLETPLLLLTGDRFLIRDRSQSVTLAGGVVIDPEARRKNFRQKRQREFLMEMSEVQNNVETAIETYLKRDRVIPQSQLLTRSHFSRADIDSGVARLERKGDVKLVGGLTILKPEWDSLCKRIGETIDTYHVRHPEQIGVALVQLPSVVGTGRYSKDLSQHVLQELTQNGFVQEGAVIRRKSHRATLPDQLTAGCALLRAILARSSIEPLSRKQLAPDSTRQEMLRFLVQRGEAIELNHELVLLTEHFVSARSAVCKFLTQHPSASVSELRDALGTSRRVMIPLLEKLDREGITKRVGDKRVLAKTCPSK